MLLARTDCKIQTPLNVPLKNTEKYFMKVKPGTVTSGRRYTDKTTDDFLSSADSKLRHSSPSRDLINILFYFLHAFSQNGFFLNPLINLPSSTKMQVAPG